MELTYKLTARDFEDGFRAYRMRKASARWFYRISLALAVVIFVMSLAAMAFFPAEERRSAIPALVASVVWFAVLVLNPKWAAKKQFKGSPSAGDPIQLRVSEEGFEVKSQFAEGKSAWNMVVGWVELETSFVLFRSPVIFFVYPKRAFTAEQASEFRSLLQKHVKN